ncbi:Copia protein [Durusdinium trenchii]|uniref:Copia protein n=1 Tax=Durusdinium trenchii TaxID=1381693 RepID=A0ABP0PPY3_9DINO
MAEESLRLVTVNQSAQGWSRMVRLQTPPEAASLEVFDLTTPREQGGEAACPWRVGMVRAADEEVDEFYGIEEDGHNDCYEPSVEVPGHVAIVAMGLWDDEMEVNMVEKKFKYKKGIGVFNGMVGFVRDSVKEMLKEKEISMKLEVKMVYTETQFNANEQEGCISSGANKITQGQFPSWLDWDGDGDVDVLKVARPGELHLHEQLFNGTFVLKVLPVPPVRDYTAADFDGDGDVDLLIAVPKEPGCRYFERTGDGSLKELKGNDNPFNSVCGSTGSLASSALNEEFKYFTLGDWDQDGDMDMIVVDAHDGVQLFKAQGVNHFLETPNSPFSTISLPDNMMVSLADLDADGDLDVIVPSHTYPKECCDMEYKYFERVASGDLVELHMAVPPLRAVPLTFFEGGTKSPFVFQRHLVADVDGDGDLDVVLGDYFSRDIQYAQQQDGQFIWLPDSRNPFYEVVQQIKDKVLCWSMVDWDRDGDLDVLAPQTYEDGKNMQLASHMRLFEQVSDGSNSSFLEVVGSRNPFDGLSIDMTAECPSLIDLDGDGDLDLVLMLTSKRFEYYEQREGRYHHATSNPFDGVSIKKGSTMQPLFTDWDGDGSLDMLVTGSTKLLFFQQGFCLPASSYCRWGSCNERTNQCERNDGVEGHDCSICGEYHVRTEDTCKKCPGYDTVSRTCSRRGMCDDDVDARGRETAANSTGFKVLSATGTGRCTCSEPFSGDACEQGACPPGQRLDRDADVDLVSAKYPRWEACVPCQKGRFKNFSGNDDCRICTGGHIPAADATSCVACKSGTTPSTDRSECSPCDTGYVAIAGAPNCSSCPAGTAPNAEGSECIECHTGQYSRPRSARCSMCEPGFAPDATRSSCQKCLGQSYANPGDELCRACSFPSMILNDDNWCTPIYTILFVFGFILLMLFVMTAFGRLRLECLRWRLKDLIQAKNWHDLHATKCTFLEYGLCKKKADRLLNARKADVKAESFQLGICLQYVFDHLEGMYTERAQQAEWRFHEWPLTKTGYLVKIRNFGLQVVDPEAAWNALPTCSYPKDPNFHQVAQVLAYGPWALGKHMCCPRDGQPDCSVVDALQPENSSGKATWFLSWVWGYGFRTVTTALSKWWQKHRIVSGDACSNIYIWWCVFVNNQFRMLEEGVMEPPDNLFDVFGQQLEGIGKMLMCLDKFKGGQYTSRIWCIFEVFVACQRSIPATVILPELEVGEIESLKDLTRECRVDAAAAKASVQADADAIKEEIQKKHQSFQYVNQTVEHALWCEVIEYLEANSTDSSTRDEGTSGVPSSEESTESVPSTSSTKKGPTSSDCSLQ